MPYFYIHRIKPLYQDLLSRTKVALAKNPGNILLAVIWMQGESDLASGSQSHNALFTGMVQKFRADIADMSGQCVGGSALSVPWVCGDTTHYWKEKYAASYETYQLPTMQNQGLPRKRR
ncbi:sialate O-acetylesterase [Escherichia coli]|nr:sialate O-acetylesterase [Escherichia coli]